MTFLVFAACRNALGGRRGAAFQGAPSGNPPVSGFADFRDLNFGNGITECPQAGMNVEPSRSTGGARSIRSSSSATAATIAGRIPSTAASRRTRRRSTSTRPNSKNIVRAQNDYRLRFRLVRVRRQLRRRPDLVRRIIPFPSTTRSAQNRLRVSGGDPVSSSTAPASCTTRSINFNRDDDDNGISVQPLDERRLHVESCPACRSDRRRPPDDIESCGGPGDPRMPGDGAVIYSSEPTARRDTRTSASPFDDKEYMAAGPRPPGVTPVCFSADRQDGDSGRQRRLSERHHRRRSPLRHVDEVRHPPWPRGPQVEDRISYSDDQAARGRPEGDQRQRAVLRVRVRRRDHM